MLPLVVRVIVSAVILVAVAELSERLPRLGALLLSLPIVSILALLMAWNRYHDLSAVSRVARETLVLVPLGLPFFVPLAFAERWGLGFWTTLAAGVAAAVITTGGYLALAAR